MKAGAVTTNMFWSVWASWEESRSPGDGEVMRGGEEHKVRGEEHR